MSKQKFLVLIDCQNDFITGALGSKEADAAVPFIVEEVKKAIKNNVRILLTYDSHYEDSYPNSLEGKKLPVPHCIVNTEGRDIDSRISELLGDDKYTNYDTYYKTTFGSDSLYRDFALYKAMGLSPSGVGDVEITVMGFCTDICVISNVLALRMAMSNATIRVKSDCCAGTSKEAHEAALTVMKSCQIDII